LRLSRRPSFPLALAAAAVGGFVESFAFPPAGIWPLAFVGIAALLWIVRSSGPGLGFVAGLVFGLAFYGTTLLWISRFGTMAFTGLTMLSALSAALFGVVAPSIRRPGRPVLTAVGLAALWTVVDWVRTMWPLGGFGWGSLGVSQVDNGITLRLASVTGAWGVTFVVVLVAALLVEAAAGGGGVRRRLGLVAAALALGVAPVVVPQVVPTGERVEIAAVQVDVREAEDPSSGSEDLAVAALNVELHRQLADDPPDLAVWGEGALDPTASSDPATIAAVRDAIAEVGAPTLVGAVQNDADGHQRTSALLFDGGGDLVGRYDKVHLVPFGEYVPFRSRLSWIGALRQIPVDREPGRAVGILSVTGLPPFGAPICFENSFPAIPRAMVRDGAGFLVVNVNNASYGFTAASDQHLQMSRMRAVENGRWVVNAAISGISAFIRPDGGVVSRLELFRPGILRGTVVASSERTMYVRLGDWVPWLSLAWVVVSAGARPRRRRSRPAPPALAPGWRTLVILPTYDERATIEAVIRGVLDRPETVDVVVVDDSSPDGTAEVVRELMATEPRVRLVERPEKAGLASAYLAGFRIALEEGYDLAVEMDSDLSHDPGDLAGILAAAAAGADLVVGSRYVRGGSVADWSRARVLLSRAGNGYARLALGVSVRDATSGFRAYRRDLLGALVAKPFSGDGYGFQIELVMRAWRGGWTTREHPITFREREHGRSKISRSIVAEALWQVTIWGLSARFNRGDAP
jgi:apolipoprotein N-acyltransferase